MIKQGTYTSEMSGSGQYGICAHCQLPPTKEGHDGCLGTLSGFVMNACCGHGETKTAYIQYYSDKQGIDVQTARFSGKQAIKLQKALK